MRTAHVEDIYDSRFIVPLPKNLQLGQLCTADTAVAPRKNLLAMLFPALVFTLSLFAAPAQADGWKAGVAKRAITPQSPMWLSGYAGRDRPADGTLTDLWAKCLVLQDAAGGRVALLTLDLIGIDRAIAVEVRRRLQEKHGLDAAHVAFCTSHTHTGPVIAGNLSTMYALDETQQRLVEEYTVRLMDEMTAVVDDAMADVSPCALAWGSGTADFAVNRRNNQEAKVPDLRAAGQLVGPVDHDVPVLRVSAADGSLRAVAFGYACHSTVLAFFQWSGDYPGFAQLELEKSHPGAVALFWAGCGADQNPLPRRTVELAQEYGRRLAASVEQVLIGDMRPISGTALASYEEVDLPFDTLPTREQIALDAESSDRYVAARAKLLLQQIDGGTPLSPTYPYPVQLWQLGTGGPTWVTLGGEVVVDYSLRLKAELGASLWVAGYANDVMAYIPSRRVLQEGGYEGGGAMVYYGLPTIWGPEVEEVIVRAVHRGAEAVMTP